MLYTANLTDPHWAQLAALDEVRRALGREASLPKPWMGRLRRDALVTAATSSTAIEGLSVDDPAEARAIVLRGASGSERNRQALAGYALAMQHVSILASDPRFRWTDRVILDLHFEATSGEPEAHPGRCRSGGVAVTGAAGVAYRAPDPAEAERLFDELVEWLEESGSLPAVVRAALAHLNLVSIHPFRDGNGRTSRIVQSLVLAREGVLAPELGSIEEYLARDTASYYRALQDAQGGSWQPSRSTAGWLSFCLEAHRVQADLRRTQIAAAAARWEALEALVRARSWPERLVIALEQSLTGGAERASYAEEAGISLATASADLRRLLDGGWVVRRGTTRDARYLGSALLAQWVRASRPQ